MPEEQAALYKSSDCMREQHSSSVELRGVEAIIAMEGNYCIRVSLWENHRSDHGQEQKVCNL